MNLVLSVVNPNALPTLEGICQSLGLPLNVTMIGHGTATGSMLDLLGIESNEKRVVLTVANPEKTKELIKEARRNLFIGVPGHGIIVAVPIKSIGGGKTVAFLNEGSQSASYKPELNYSYELIIAIANIGHTDDVMNAARAAGATGGTVLHGKGTGSKEAEKFLHVSIAQEKEVIVIVAKSQQKSEIMKQIISKAGVSTPAGAIAFSLPTSEVAGFGMFDQNA